MKSFNQTTLLVFTATLAGLCFVLALHTGAMHISVWKGVSDALSDAKSIDRLILCDIRLPRALLALLIGATLGLSGAALQGLLRNPLAEPGIIGVSNGAALGAVIVFYFGLSNLAWFVLPLGGLVGALVSVLVIFALTGKHSSTLTLILAGIAINAIGGALIALALNLAPSPYAMQEIVFWLLGSVSNRSMNHVWIALPFMLVGWLMILSCARFLNALTLGQLFLLFEAATVFAGALHRVNSADQPAAEEGRRLTFGLAGRKSWADRAAEVEEWLASKPNRTSV